MHAPLNLALRAEWCGLDQLTRIAEEWRALADRTIEPNVFYDPAFMLAAAPVLGADAGAVVVRSSTGRLAGLFPARIGRARGGLLPMLIGWTHSFAPLGTPLVDRTEPEKVITAWLDMVSDPAMPSTMLLPLLPENGAFARVLDTVLERSGRRYVQFDRHQRAALDPGADRGDYIERAMSTGRRKQLRRLRRRLEDIGSVSFNTATGDEAAAALKDFCVLEASGWKGLAGTAIISDPAITSFVQSAVTTLASQDRARIDRLFLNGEPIAATITLLSGDTAWCWKIAYREDVARFSPGVQHMLELTESLLSKAEPVRVDSCAAADHPMIDHVWSERLELSDRLIALRPSAMPFTAAHAAETGRRRLIRTAKTLRDTLRRR